MVDATKNPPKNPNIKEMLFLAERAAQGKIKVLPGKQWSLHYALSQEQRAAKLDELRQGKITAAEAETFVKPDILIFNAEDINTQGLAAVQARILDISNSISYYDYPRYARFMAEVGGENIDLATSSELYNSIAKSRIQQRLREAKPGRKGRAQIDAAIRVDKEQILASILKQSAPAKVMSVLKLDWLCENLNLATALERDEVVAQLSGEQRAMVQKLQTAHHAFVERGDEIAFEELVSTLKTEVPKLLEKKDDSSDSMKELEEELEKYKEQSGPPGTEKDSAIPPEDQDEYITPPSTEQAESQETKKSPPMFTIEPPLSGYYIVGRKSYYDVNKKTWSKKKQLGPYTETLSTSKTHKISGKSRVGTIALPIPNSYAVDASTLTFNGSQPEILRDQNGCFYLQCDSVTDFSLEFGKEDAEFINPPIPEDLELLYQGTLSEKTEKLLSHLPSDDLQKAEAIRQFVLANHFYPGGGDLKIAGALQAKLRSESTGDNYLQNIDASEYLECYSANTLFIALARKAGISTRLVVGHKPQGAKEGKTAIDETTGHAWSEVWDGSSWRRFDSTPKPKPEDKKPKDQEEQEKEQEEQQQPPENAEDGGVENRQQKPDQQGDKKSQQGQGQQQEGQQMDSGSPDQMQEASQDQMNQAQTSLEQAKAQLEQMEKQKSELEQDLGKAKSFEDLKKLEEKIDKKELLDEMKKDLQKKLEAIEKQMKDKIKEALDKMREEGFIDEAKQKQWEKQLDEKQSRDLDRLMKTIDAESELYREYDKIREEVLPIVDQWFKYFVRRLPKKQTFEADEDSKSRQGAINKHLLKKPGNLLFGTVKNPRVQRSSVEPLFLASLVLDVSPSMLKDPNNPRSIPGSKLESGRKLMVFFNELFSKIEKEFGYIRFANYVFSRSLNPIKTFKQKYNSSQVYEHADGTKSTVKVHLMKGVVASPYTNIDEAVRGTAKDLNEEARAYPNYASAMYFVGDGQDSFGREAQIKAFLESDDREKGFGNHMRSAIMMGTESEKEVLANIFGEDNTAVALEFEPLITKWMEQFEDNIKDYLRNKQI